MAFLLKPNNNENSAPAWSGILDLFKLIEIINENGTMKK